MPVAEIRRQYDTEFFEEVTDLAATSARVIVPLILDLVPIESVVDVGCGLGMWLRVFREQGVATILGIDGDYVDRARLMIEPDQFRAIDLSHPFILDRAFDLAVCLEVAEHLPAHAALEMVGSLCRSAPIVLFSAAIPGQRGTKHINEQWPWYWEALFNECGFIKLDPIRKVIWHDRRVAWFYRQNLVLYASSEAIARSPALQREPRLETGNRLELVHTDVLLQQLHEIEQCRSVLGVARQVPILLRAAVERRVPTIFRRLAGSRYDPAG